MENGNSAMRTEYLIYASRVTCSKEFHFFPHYSWHYLHFNYTYYTNIIFLDLVNNICPVKHLAATCISPERKQYCMDIGK